MNTASDSFTSEAQMPAMSGTPGAVPRDPVIVSRKHSAAVVLSVLLGGLGIDRMYTGRVALGILKLLFGWLTFGIWQLVDWILIASGKARDGNGAPLIALGLIALEGETPSQPRPGELSTRPATASYKHVAAVVLSVFLGWLGIDRMYTGRVRLGILKLIMLVWCATLLMGRSSGQLFRPLLEPLGFALYYDGGTVETGILLLITLVGIGVWYIVDMCLIGMGSAKDGDGNPLISYHHPVASGKAAPTQQPTVKSDSDSFEAEPRAEDLPDAS